MKISVFIPCIINHWHYIDEIMSAYRSGTEKPYEIVVFVSGANVGANTHTATNVHSVPDIMVRVPDIVRPGPARQRALDLCRGDIIMYQDADDLPTPRRVEVVRWYFENFDIVHLTHSYNILGSEPVDDQKTWFLTIKPNEILRKYFPGGNISECLKLCSAYGAPMMRQHAGVCCIKKEVLNKVTWKKNEDLVLVPVEKYRNKSEDYQFCMETAFHFKKSMMTEAKIYQYRT